MATILTETQRKALEDALNVSPSMRIHITPGGHFESVLEVIIESHAAELAANSRSAEPS